ncbi:deoxyribose-phosphate aldolase [Hahella chejuensis KCTC 2396]|uniref:Deoxyribose-phosphate aldolase n=1 Tax=Hahella chejuensis (strain KCTC 2396) TaxID=349521 RepID=Q2SHN4_HAHCH|nr:deoxyribose-phosphate aldolase [Hahella chejuensis]ABC29840.1 deoxyribose-phosphate aldolase [Hahella chejuensis KCTC 2396]
MRRLTLQEAARLSIPLLDLTSLNDADTDASITALCQKARTPEGWVAAVCVYPRFVALAKQILSEAPVKVATVVNFPHGEAPADVVIVETTEAIRAGADEIDLVFPYKALLAGDENTGRKLVAAVKAACGEAVRLKVIIESGELKTPDNVRRASELAIAAGADFLKTSTGKVKVNATLDAAEVMLNCIRESRAPVGFKAAGGVSTPEQARLYLSLAMNIMGDDWVSPDNFRFGASSLLHNLLVLLGHGSDHATLEY